MGPNSNDGDRNFGKGFISNRVDLFSEFDIVHDDGYGARVSGAGWYDAAYDRNNDNRGFAGGAFPNQISLPYNSFTNATRNVYGRDAKLLDAFVLGKFAVGNMPLTLRAGQYASLWGESLFFGGNSIAAAQAPVEALSR